MFEVDKNTMAVTLHQGDTGAFWCMLDLGSGNEFVEGDVAIFEVWQNKTLMMHREYELQPETPTDICPGDGKFLIAFRNSDTENWTPGAAYNSEIRVSLNPVREDGKVVDGNTVRTIVQSTINIRAVRIEI